jgi:peptide subunit release factor 1 (eRF1)
MFLFTRILTHAISFIYWDIIKQGVNMKLEHLENIFRKLTSLEETANPILSCYINNENFDTTYRELLDYRIKQIRKVLSYRQRESFENALGQIEAYLVSKVAKDSKGIAIFARMGKSPTFEAIQFKIPFKTELSIDSIPHLYQLVLMKDTYSRYVVLISEESHARIVEVSVGNITKELWTEKPELKVNTGRGWTKQHYQNHKRERNQKFIKEKIKVLDQLFTEGKHNHLVLAGKKQNILGIRDKLPKRLQEKLVDEIHVAGIASTADVIEASLSVFADYEQNESVNNAGMLLLEIKKGGLAVSDSEPSLKALQEGRVDILIMSENYNSPDSWKCHNCSYIEIGKNPKACGMCGSPKTSKIKLKQELILLAEQMSTNIEILRDSDELYEVNGIGCLLRF